MHAGQDDTEPSRCAHCALPKPLLWHVAFGASGGSWSMCSYVCLVQWLDQPGALGVRHALGEAPPSRSRAATAWGRSLISAALEEAPR